MKTNQPTTFGEQLIANTDLHRLKGELDSIRHIPFDQRIKRRQIEFEIKTIEQTDLFDAKQNLENVEAMLMLAVNDATDQATGKPKYTNETTRKAALVLAMRDSVDYQAAYNRFRDVEKRLLEKRNLLQECEDNIKSNAELTWTLRSLVDAARAEIVAVCTFDGPIMPAEIRITGPEQPIKIEALGQKGAA